MNFFKELKFKFELKKCDYNVARLAINYQFPDHALTNELADIVNDFLENPCFDTAIKVIESNPEFLVYFIESKPDGFFVRNLESIKAGIKSKKNSFKS